MLVASASGGRAHQVHSGVLDVGQEEGVQGVQPSFPQVPQVARHQRRPRLHQHQLPSAFTHRWAVHRQASGRQSWRAARARPQEQRQQSLLALCVSDLETGHGRAKAVIHVNSIPNVQGGACTCFSAR